MEEKEARCFDILLSPGFLFGLLLLLLNDFVLKPQFHNSLTGKLSDFAGLFIFPMFFAAFIPHFKIHIYILTAVLFVFWKSPLSQAVIEAWNSLAILRIGRTVDYTDLFALVILPISLFYKNFRSISRNKFALSSVLVMIVFAFSATQYRKEPPLYNYKDEYQFNQPKSQLVEKIKKLKPDFAFMVSERVGTGTYSAKYDECPDYELEIKIFIGEMNGLSIIGLREISNRCPGKNISQEQLRQFFEKDLIEKLKATKLQWN
jgi:hypothetical protein